MDYFPCICIENTLFKGVEVTQLHFRSIIIRTGINLTLLESSWQCLAVLNTVLDNTSIAVIYLQKRKLLILRK